MRVAEIAERTASGGSDPAPSRPAEIDALSARPDVRMLVVEAGDAPLRPGSLRSRLEDAVESALAHRGALPPAIAVGQSIAIVARDQLQRARALGLSGIALHLPRLAPAADDGGTLGADDGATLQSFAEAAREAPLALLLDPADQEIRALAPVRVADLFAHPEARGPARSEPSSDPALEAPAAALEIAEDLTPPPPTRRSTSASRALSAAEWRSHAIELDRARGPKPVRQVEQLFVTRYAPLLGAVLRGDADGTVRSVVDAWRDGFAHSYRDAFSALRVTGKRPSMVLDAPEMAGRLARLNGARAVRLVLIDSMGFDLGERVQALLRERVAGTAVALERQILWSALPSITPVQLALLGRGAEGLRDAAPPSDPEPEITRGRAVSTLRRVRIGHRDLMKLDLVEARLRNAGPPYDERLDALADEIASVVGRFVASLPPRTLLFLFGDHGFRLDPSPAGEATGPASQGGASPEEVLVPAYAFFIGGVH